MKLTSRILCLLALAAPLLAHAELFIGPTTATNRFVLAAGQAAIISRIYPQTQYNATQTLTNTVPMAASIIASGATNPVYIAECRQASTALAGPMELVLTTPGVISYRVVANSSIESLVVKPGTTNTLVVLAGKSLRFFAYGLDGYTPLIPNVELIRDKVSFKSIDIHGNEECTGPVVLRFVYPVFPPNPGNPQKAFTLPFYVTDQALVLPDQAVLQSPTGGFEIQVQKSTDTQNWFPSITVPAASDTKAFYRLRITK